MFNKNRVISLIFIYLLSFSFSTLSFSYPSNRNPRFKNFGFSIPLNSKTKNEIAMNTSHDKMRHKGMSYSGGVMWYGAEMLAPIGFMGGHSLSSGHLMFTYRFMHMSMKGDLLRGGKAIDISQATEYTMLPKEMTMDMHMFALMYEPVDRLTIMAMISYMEKRMVMQMRMMPSTEIVQQTSGFGDLKIVFGYAFFKTNSHKLKLDLGFGLPTGSIDEVNPSTNKNFGYPLQIGSGSFELIPALTYIASLKTFLAWGAQFKTTFRLNENKNSYTLGNRYEGTIWAAYRFIDWVSISARLNLDIQDNIDGTGSNQSSSSMMPASDPNAYGYTRLDALVGLNFYLPLGAFHNKIAVEGGVPLAQSVSGVKRGVDWILTAGISFGYAF